MRLQTIPCSRRSITLAHRSPCNKFCPLLLCPTNVTQNDAGQCAARKSPAISNGIRNEMPEGCSMSERQDRRHLRATMRQDYLRNCSPRARAVGQLSVCIAKILQTWGVFSESCRGNIIKWLCRQTGMNNASSAGLHACLARSPECKSNSEVDE